MSERRKIWHKVGCVQINCSGCGNDFYSEDYSREENMRLAALSRHLTFTQLRAANVARLPQFKNKHGELAHSQADGSDWSPAEWLEAVIGELGEYANEAKKFRRGDLTHEEFLAKAAKELADVQIYLDILAYQLRIDLGEATRAKFNEVSDRIGCSIKL